MVGGATVMVVVLDAVAPPAPRATIWNVYVSGDDVVFAGMAIGAETLPPAQLAVAGKPLAAGFVSCSVSMQPKALETVALSESIPPVEGRVGDPAPKLWIWGGAGCGATVMVVVLDAVVPPALAGHNLESVRLR